MKNCSKCNVEKPFSEFSKRASSKDGHNVWCKPCKKEYDRSYFKENRKKILETSKQYKAKNPEKWVSYSKAYYKANREEMLFQNKAARIKSKYGATIDEVERLLSSQDRKCGICDEDISDRYVIDHNHSTGEVRGLLCSSCNIALGGFKDSPDVLLSAVSYLHTKGHYGRKTTPST